MNDASFEAFLKHKNNLYELLLEGFELNYAKYKEGSTDYPPDIYLLNLSDKFLKQFRRTSNKDFLEISKTIRKAAHKIHWKMIKLNYTNKSNKFINIV